MHDPNSLWAACYPQCYWRQNELVNQQELKCYKIQQLMIAVLYSNGQQRTQNDGDVSKFCCKYSSRRLLTMMIVIKLHLVSVSFGPRVNILVSYRA